MTYSQHRVVWYLLALNWVRRQFGRPEKRYLTDYEWKRYMSSLAPKRPLVEIREGWLKKNTG